MGPGVGPKPVRSVECGPTAWLRRSCAPRGASTIVRSGQFQSFLGWGGSRAHRGSVLLARGLSWSLGCCSTLPSVQNTNLPGRGCGRCRGGRGGPAGYPGGPLRASGTGAPLRVSRGRAGRGGAGTAVGRGGVRALRCPKRARSSGGPGRSTGSGTRPTAATTAGTRWWASRVGRARRVRADGSRTPARPGAARHHAGLPTPSPWQRIDAVLLGRVMWNLIRIFPVEPERGVR